MPDYLKMYVILCGAASEAIDLIHQNQTEDAAHLLQQSLVNAEEIYIQSTPSFREQLGHVCKAALPHILVFLAVLFVLFVGFVAGGVFVLRWG